MGPKADKFEVFLGGSCGGRAGPTTWRKQKAIPALEDNKLSYFNPQVDTWTADLIEKENTAKDNSDFLLFVLETKTRGIVAMVEVAYLAGKDKAVVYAPIEDRAEGHISIVNDVVTEEEKKDIKNSQNILAAILARSQRCATVTAVEQSIEYIVNNLPHRRRILKFRFPIDKIDVNRWMKKLHRMVKKHLDEKKGKEEQRQKKDQKPHQQETCRHPEPVDRLAMPSPKPSSKPSSKPSPKPSVAVIAAESSSYDAFKKALKAAEVNLGFSHEIDVSHLECTTTDDSLRAQQVDRQSLKNKYQQIVALVPSSELACSAMCQAAYLLPELHSTMVFAIADIQEGFTIGSDTLTSDGVADFNRGRKYLRTMVAENNAASYDCTDMAAQCVINRLRNLFDQNNNYNPPKHEAT